MKPETTRHVDHIMSSYLYMAIELSQKEWKLGFTIGFGQKPRLRNLVARDLVAQGVTNLIVDSASIEVNRRKRRAKTDRMDVGKLLTMLIRYQQGEKKVWSIVHVPSPEEEDQRQLHRKLLAVKAERTRRINRSKGLLSSQGVVLKVKADFLAQLEGVRLWDGSQLPQDLHSRVRRLLRQAMMRPAFPLVMRVRSSRKVTSRR